MSDTSTTTIIEKTKKLLQRVPNSNINTRGVLGDWINDAQNVLWDIIWKYDSSQPSKIKEEN